MLAAIFYSLMYAVFNVTGAVLIKSELKGHTLTSLHDYVNLLLTFKVIAGFVIIFLSALIFFKALSLTKFSIVVPLANGLNFCITLACGYFIFSEKLSVSSLIGLLLIIAGILIIGISNNN